MGASSLVRVGVLTAAAGKLCGLAQKRYKMLNGNAVHCL